MLMMPPKRKRKTLPPSGPHTNPRRKVSATREQWLRWDEAAARLGKSWAAATREYWDMIAPERNDKTPAER